MVAIGCYQCVKGVPGVGPATVNTWVEEHTDPSVDKFISFLVNFKGKKKNCKCPYSRHDIKGFAQAVL